MAMPKWVSEGQSVGASLIRVGVVCVGGAITLTGEWFSKCTRQFGLIFPPKMPSIMRLFTCSSECPWLILTDEEGVRVHAKTQATAGSAIHAWDHDASAQKRWIPPPAAHVAVTQNRFNTPSIESKQPNT